MVGTVSAPELELTDQVVVVLVGPPGAGESTSSQGLARSKPPLKQLVVTSMKTPSMVSENMFSLKAVICIKKISFSKVYSSLF